MSLEYRFINLINMIHFWIPSVSKYFKVFEILPVVFFLIIKRWNVPVPKYVFSHSQIVINQSLLNIIYSSEMEKYRVEARETFIYKLWFIDWTDWQENCENIERSKLPFDTIKVMLLNGKARKKT